MPDVRFSAVETRSVQIPVPCDSEAAAKAFKLLYDAATAGFTVKTATEISSGHQRDPFTIGLAVTMQK